MIHRVVHGGVPHDFEILTDARGVVIEHLESGRHVVIDVGDSGVFVHLFHDEGSDPVHSCELVPTKSDATVRQNKVPLSDIELMS